MKTKACKIVAAAYHRVRAQAVLAMLVALVGGICFGGCATKPQVVQVEDESGQMMTMPRSTWTGAASGEQANALAREMAQVNKNQKTQADMLARQIQQANTSTMQRFDQLDGNISSLRTTHQQELQTSQQALAKLEQLSSEQGSGEVTLFFKTGSVELDHFQYQRLVNFLDYLARHSHGRTIIIVSIGSASATGSPRVNKKLSTERSETPLPVIDQYLIDTPHKFYKVTGIGDLYAPKNAPANVEYRYQNVRIIAAYDAANLPQIPES